MEQFFLFQYALNQRSNTNYRLIIFCAGTKLDFKILKKHLRDFFAENYPPNEINLVGGNYLKEELVSEFASKRSEVFDVIRSFDGTGDRIKIVLFDEKGKFADHKDNPISDVYRDEILNNGIKKIFHSRGGLINAPTDSFHYIFPSGKHSSKFIRAGNVLIDGSEIFFIALSLLRHFKNNYAHIYCDTSSINSLAFALVELLKRFSAIDHSPSISSFGSYEKFEKFDFDDSKNSLILISASTSGNIVRRLLEHHSNLVIDNILILFYLSEDREFNSRVICDLTKSDSNPEGITTSDIYSNELKCDLCKQGSYKVKISGDIFLLEKPHIDKIILGVKDAPSGLSQFMKEFHSRNGFSLIRCFFGEEPSRIFELFLDSSVIEDQINSNGMDSSGLYGLYIEKYQRLLHQHIPSNLKFIIHLPDKASQLIARRIKEIYMRSGVNEPSLISSTDLLKADYPIPVKESGAILITCSCLVTGSNLLYVNKFLRRHEKLAKTFFVAFARPSNNSKLDFVIKNICQGDLGTTQVISVDKIFCSDYSENTNDTGEISWLKEMEFLKKLKTLIDGNDKFSECLEFVKARLKILEGATDISSNRGLINDVFLKNPLFDNVMQIAKNFAFFNFEGYHSNASQADIYFTISCVLNNLRYSQNKDRRIIQEEYRRTLIDPENFTRFDDGIIQSTFLRCAKEEELNYQIDFDSSNRMKEIVFKMIDGHKDKNSSEALVEFLFALAIKKMRLFDSHLEKVLNKVEGTSDNKILLLFSLFIRRNVLKATT